MILILIGCNSNNIILKTSYYEGAKNDLKRSYKYDTKNKTFTSEIDGIVTIKNFKMKKKEKLDFIKRFNSVNIHDNYCWKSLETLPEYSWKYEIVFNKKKQMPKCVEMPKYEIYQTYNALKDTIKKKNTITNFFSFELS